MKKAIACAIVAGLASSASAGLITPGEVNLTYASPAGPKTVVYTAPGAGESFGTITVSTAVTLTVDLSGVGGSVVTFDNARVQMSASVTTANEVAPFTMLAGAFDGSFEFVDTQGTPDTGDDESIVSATFGSGPGQAALFAIFSSGSLSANDSNAGGNLDYTIGSALGAFLPGFTADGDANAAWGLSAIAPVASLRGDNFLNSFDANGAFTGSFGIIPNAGSITLATIAGLMVTVRRKRS